MALGRQLHTRQNLNLLITVAGGYMDAYSYLARGKVFATGQTGNFVLLAVNLARLDLPMVVHYLTPILLFWLGIFVSMHMRHKYFRENVFLWERETLRAEIGLFLLVGFLPDTIPDVLVNSLISFCAAMQYCCFRTMGENAAYASIFCTGNMRSCAEQLYLGLIQKERKSLESGLRYLGILSAFFIGVLLGVLGDYWLHIKAAWGICVLLLMSLTVLRLIERKENNQWNSVK